MPATYFLLPLEAGGCQKELVSLLCWRHWRLPKLRQKGACCSLNGLRSTWRGRKCMVQPLWHRRGFDLARLKMTWKMEQPRWPWINLAREKMHGTANLAPHLCRFDRARLKTRPQKRTAAVARRAQTRPNWGADSTGAAAITPNTLHKITAKMAKTLGLDQNDENQSKNSWKEVKMRLRRTNCAKNHTFKTGKY
jgi:hypothetical protein